MLRFTWIPRTLLAVLLLSVVLVTVSGLLELSSSVRLAAAQGRSEASLVTRSVVRELGRLAGERPAAPLDSLCAAPSLQEVMRDALALAPSILHVAIETPEGVVVAHTQPLLVGSVVPEHPPMAEPRSFGGSLKLLRDLTRGSRTFQYETSLSQENRPFATVRIDLAGSFLLDAIREAASRGMLAALIIISLAVIAGVLLTRLATGRIQLLRAGVAALREGRYDQRLPENGVDEFSYLARELNLLGMKFEEEQRRVGEGQAVAASDDSLHSVVWRDQSRVLARLGQTAAGIAHELRNHLQTVHFALQALQQADELPRDQLNVHVARATQSVESLGGAVSGFLKVARVKPLSPEPVMVNDFLTGIARELRTEAALAGIQLQLELDFSIPETWADAEVLRQAVHNLVRNSLQALSGKPDGRVSLRSGNGEASLSISVADNGPGIPAEILEHVFDLYFTTRRDGSGVGLALVRQAVEMHGGDVVIKSREGEGTEVMLEIPLRRSSAHRPA